LDEYISCLTSAELAMSMALKYGEDPNKAVSRCCKVLEARCKINKNKKLFRKLRKYDAPAAAILLFRKQLNEALRGLR